MLRLIITVVDKIYLNSKSQPYLATLYKAIFLAAYYGLLRIGEVTISPHVILARNIHIGKNKQKLLFKLDSSKTHNKCDKPQIVKISSKPLGYVRKDMQKFCPFSILKNYIWARPLAKNCTEQFFVFRDNLPVHPGQVHQVLKSSIAVAGLDLMLYIFHCFWAGRSSDLVDLGLSVETIKKIGRWRSNVVFTYLKGC